MLQLSYDEIIAKIKEHSKLSESEINSKIDLQLEKLKGFISKEGAAHIVANELGLKIFDQPTGRLKIDQIRPGMRDIEIIAKVMRKFEVRDFNTNGRSGKVGNIVLGDESGTIRSALWGSIADNIPKMSEGDVVKIESAYARENNGNPELHLNDNSKIIMNPAGESVGQVSQRSTSVQRKQIADITEDDKNVEIVATIVQAFDPRFFEICPECNKRARMRGEDTFFCEEHGTVKPSYAYLINLVLDDGTSNIRTVFFREQANSLTKKSTEEFLAMKDNQGAIDALKHDLLGQIIKVVGGVKKNDMFERVEFVARQVFVDLDPDQEIAALDKEIQKVRSSEKVPPSDSRQTPTIQHLAERKKLEGGLNGGPSARNDEGGGDSAENNPDKVGGEPASGGDASALDEDEAIDKILNE